MVKAINELLSQGSVTSLITEFVNAQLALMRLPPLLGGKRKYVTDKAPSKQAPKLIGSAVENPSFAGDESEFIDWDKVNKQKQEAQEKADKKRIDGINYIYKLNDDYEKDLTDVIKERDQKDEEYAKHMSDRHKRAGKERRKLEDDVTRYIGTKEEALFGGIQNGFSGMASDLSSAWQNMWAKNIGNTKTLVAQLIQSIVDSFLAMAARMAAMAIFQLIFPTSWGSLLGMGAYKGGEFSYAAGGGDASFGNGTKNVLVGDDNGKINRTTELMQVGSRGVRIISNSNMQKMTQFSQASKSGSNSAMANAISNLNANVARLSAHNGNSILVMTQLAKEARTGRVG